MHVKKLALGFAKFGLSAALIGYLIWKLSSENSFPRLQQHLTSPDPPKYWTFVALSWLAAFGGITANIFRWRMLCRTLGLQLTLRDALRVGYVSNFVAQLGFGLGLVGGDAVRAVHLAHTNPQMKAEGAATVVVDRALGLLSLLVMAAVASFCLPLNDSAEHRSLRDLFWFVRVVGLVSVIGCGVVLIPGFTHWSLWDTVSHVPKIGGILLKLVNAMRIYRRRLDALIMALGMSIVSQSLAIISLYWAATGLNFNCPSLGMHFVVGPLAMIANALPIGAFELTMGALYRVTVPDLHGEEYVVAIAFRVIWVSIALVGLVVYLATRSESAALLEESAKLAEKAE